MRLLPTRVLLVVLAVALGVACGASDPPSPPARNPLEERTTPTPTPTAFPLTPAAGMSSVAPAMGGPGSVADPEGAAGHAIEFLAQALGIPPTELRLVSVAARTWPDACRGQAIPGRDCEPRETGGWTVTLRDAFDGLHTANVSVEGTSWVPQAQETGVILTRDEATRFVGIGMRGAPLTPRILNTVGSVTTIPRVGTRVAFGYDPSPRGDGIPVLTWIVAIP